jgi:alkanesulfonate monooxygenase SsuD/methylene tetrahydromethanopterin reductase-like flavin-dependent oxidoreductase (luciferase family)
VPNVKVGAARAGRAPADVDVTVGFPSVLTRDDSGVELAKGQVMMFATALDSAPAYADSIAAAGYGDVAEEVRARVSAGDLPGAVASLPDEMADALTISGSPERVRSRIEAYREAGLTGVMLNPSPPGGYFPLYEGHFPAGAELPPFDFPAFVRGLDDTIELLGS